MRKLIYVTVIAFIVISLLLSSCYSPITTTTSSSTTTTVTTPTTSSTSSQPPTTTTITNLPEVIFNFDSGIPVLAPGVTIPFDQTSAGITAVFSSPDSPNSFSVQNAETTFVILSQFSGNYLNDGYAFLNRLQINFNVPVQSINLTFATIEYHGAGEVDVPTSIKLTAYLDSMDNVVGTATGRGISSDSSFPQGILSYNSDGKQFNMIIIELLPQTKGATDFCIDNIIIEPGQ